MYRISVPNRENWRTNNVQLPSYGGIWYTDVSKKNDLVEVRRYTTGTLTTRKYYEFYEDTNLFRTGTWQMNRKLKKNCSDIVIRC